MSENNSWEQKGGILSLFAETNIHVGIGQVSGHVDLPIARDAITQVPVIPGSSLKGALRDKCRQVDQEKIETLIFGESAAEDGATAGGVLVGEAKLLLLPIRSQGSFYKWITCPSILKRLVRDLELMNLTRAENGLTIPTIPEGKAIICDGSETVSLEEFNLEAEESSDELIKSIWDVLNPISTTLDLGEGLEKKLVILNDVTFQYFAKFALPVRQRNKLDPITKTVDSDSGGLWTEEYVPADSVFYSICLERYSGSVQESESPFISFSNLVKDTYLQVGGKETVGCGWFKIRFSGNNAAGDE